METISNKELYQKIIYNISREVKRALNENINQFDVVDYQDDNQDLVDQESINNIVIRKPKNIDDENRFFEEVKPSDASLERAQQMINRVKNIFKPLKQIKISEKCLNHNKWLFYLRGYFFVVSNFENRDVRNTWDYSMIEFVYNISADKFDFFMDLNSLAKLIEFCNLYKNPIDFYFKGYEDYFEAFQRHLQETLKFTDEIDGEFIYAGDGFKSDRSVNCIDKVFEKACLISEEFVRFVPNYIRKIDQDMNIKTGSYDDYINEKISYNKFINYDDILNEDIQQFNVEDYEEKEYGIPDYHTIRNVSAFPKNTVQEAELFKKTEPSEKSLRKAEYFINKMKLSLNTPPFLEKQFSEEYLDSCDDRKISLWCQFFIISEFSNHLFQGKTYFDFKYNPEYNMFIFENDSAVDHDGGVNNLAKIIEFCELYNNCLTIIYLERPGDYFAKFKEYLKQKGIDFEKVLLPMSPEEHFTPLQCKSIDKLFNDYIYRIYKEFYKFMESYQCEK